MPHAPPSDEDTQPIRKSERPGGPKALIGLVISDRYRIEKLLGEGGMGAVYQAEHTLMRKRMAIKVLHPEMTRQPEVVARFEREAMAAAHIDHPHVVTATDFGKLEDGSFFLALEYVEGRSLREVIAEGPLELGRALHIGRQIAAALSRAHTLKIVHRDLKPENVMLVERDGDPNFAKVLDFGIAKVQIGELAPAGAPAGPGQAVLTQAGMVYGTPEYMAPEQALGQPVDTTADLYALGVIIYEMLCGVRPFEAESKVALLGMQVTAPVPPIATRAPHVHVPAEVEALIVRLLAKESTERLGDARVLIEELGSVMGQLAQAGEIDGTYATAPSSALLSSPGRLSNAMRTPAPIPRQPPTSQAIEKPQGGKTWIIAAAAGTVGIVVLVGAVAMGLRSRTAGPTPAPDEDAAATIELDDNVTPLPINEQVEEAVGLIERGDYGSGIDKLEALGDQVNGNERVHRALVGAYGSTGRPKAAMREARLLLKANAKLDMKSEVKLRLAVRDTALLEGSKDANKKAAADQAFTLFEREMGAVGWDDLYDLAWGSSGAQYPAAAKRARGALQHGERAKMSPALAVTVDLHTAGSTCAVKRHFEQAAKHGDERTLAVLRPLKKPRIVGAWKKKDLLGCIHGDGSLNKTIGQIEGRLRRRR